MICFHSYAVLLIEKKDLEGQSQVLTAALAVRLIHFLATFWKWSCFACSILILFQTAIR
jgi:hypothetical protein